MLLMLGCDEDRLTAEVRWRVIASGSPVLQLSEPKLFAAVPFSLEINRIGRSGFLRWDGRRVPLHEITSVFFRLPRLWWPSSAFDMQDQLFVYHETASSWFSLLSGLSCVQINRFGLGWWVHDLCYLDQLRFGIAERLGLVASEAAPTPQHPVRSLPTS